MTIEEKLNSIRETKEAIKTSIRNKGVVLEDTAPFNTYPSKIDEITTEVETENIEITPTKEVQTINRSEDKYIESVKVNAIPDEYIIPSGNLDITENGSYDITDKASVNVEIASSGDVSDYFNTTFNSYEAQYWIENYYLKKQGPSINVGTYSTSLQNFVRDYKSKYIPKINFSNNITNLAYMYNGCSLVETIDLSGWNTENVTTMQSLFSGCEKLTEINNINKLVTDKVTTFYSMFNNCYLLTNLDLSHFITENVTTMGSMFNNCYNFASVGPGEEYDLNINNWNTGNVTSVVSMFAVGSHHKSRLKLTTINLSHFITENLTNMSYIFQYQSKLTSIDLSGWNTENVTNMSYAFQGCDSLVDLNIGHFDLSSVTTISYIFTQQTSMALTNLTFGTNLGKGYTRTSANYLYYGLDLSNCNNLSHDSLIDVINKLYDLNLTYDVANGGTLYTQKLVLGATNMAKLTEEEIAIATNKGWVVS